MIRRVTVPALFPPPAYSHVSAVEAGTRLAFLAGSVPLDAEGEPVGVACLGYAGQLVEITATAVVPDTGAGS
ncbi:MULTISPECIES: hypothetical protein [unclassified Streptomyces]|uniref:hypothetical protein n=1 Tax=unclassified Streptomyces TaxID=2593676 RepID=UPI00093E470B|nr:hypothetical protein [Streptomyces sp. CB02400]OKJ91852.1 hypothetical protein AMK33_34785 [Streptomyces sp. CB02400]